MANTFKNAFVTVGATATTLYTVPAATTSVISGLTVANIDGTIAYNVTIEVTDTSAAATYKLLDQQSIAAKESLIWPKNIYLEATDVLKITSSDASKLEASAFVLEMT